MSNFQLGQNLVITNVNADYWNSVSPNTLDSIRSWAANNYVGKIIIPQGEWNETVFNSFKNANANYLQSYLWNNVALTSMDISSVVWTEWVEECPYLSILIIDSAHVSNMNSTFSGYTWYNDPEVWSDLPDATNKLFRFPRATNVRLESKSTGNEGLLALNRDTNQLAFVNSSGEPVNSIIDPSMSSSFSSLATQATDPETFSLQNMDTSTPSAAMSGVGQPLNVLIIYAGDSHYIDEVCVSLKTLNDELVAAGVEPYHADSQFSYIAKPQTASDANLNQEQIDAAINGTAYYNQPYGSGLFNGSTTATGPYNVIVHGGNYPTGSGTHQVLQHYANNLISLLTMLFVHTNYGPTSQIIPNVESSIGEQIYNARITHPSSYTGGGVSWTANFTSNQVTGGSESFLKGITTDDDIKDLYYQENYLNTAMYLLEGANSDTGLQHRDYVQWGTSPDDGDFPTGVYLMTEPSWYSTDYRSIAWSTFSDPDNVNANRYRRVDINTWPNSRFGSVNEGPGNYGNYTLKRLLLNSLYWCNYALPNPTSGVD